MLNLSFKKQIGIIGLMAGTLFCATTANAGDPACEGKDQSVCDTLGAMINAKGKGCYEMTSVQQTGTDGYRVSCVVSSTSSERASYTIQFSADQSSYTLR